MLHRESRELNEPRNMVLMRTAFCRRPPDTSLTEIQPNKLMAKKISFTNYTWHPGLRFYIANWSLTLLHTKC